MTLERKGLSAVILVSLSLALLRAAACSWAIGHFYQVTALRGTVVGTNLPLVRSFRWLRQSIVRPNVKLTLFDYRWPRTQDELVPIESVVTDSKGDFDFGALKPGHYSLSLEENKWPYSDWFDVEVKEPLNPRESETIDMSPVSPDCSGGHEFILKVN